MASLVSAVPQKLPTTCILLLSSPSCGFGHIPPAPAKPFSLVAVFIENVKNTHVGDCRLSVCPSVLSLQGISQPGWASPGPSTGQQPPSFLSSFFPSLLFLSLRPRPRGCAQSWVSSRVSGLQGPSLLLQLLLRLCPSLATCASGSERIRYLRGRNQARCRAAPQPRAWRPQFGVGLGSVGGTYTMSLSSSRVSGGGLIRT